MQGRDPVSMVVVVVFMFQTDRVTQSDLSYNVSITSTMIGSPRTISGCALSANLGKSRRAAVARNRLIQGGLVKVNLDHITLRFRKISSIGPPCTIGLKSELTYCTIITCNVYV